MLNKWSYFSYSLLISLLYIISVGSKKEKLEGGIRMKRKWILSIFSAVLAFGLLVGCSGEGEEVPESNEGMNEDIDMEAPSSTDVPVEPDNDTDSSSEPIEEPTDETQDADENTLDEEPADEDDSEKDSN